MKFSKINILAAYQILGGVSGLGFTLYLITTLPNIPALLFVVLAVPLILYSHSIIAGILILKKPLLGLKHSRINQVLQIFNFSFFGYTFQYISGLYFSIGIDITSSLEFKFNIGTSTWQIAIGSENIVSVFNFNLVALFLIIFIERQIKRIKNKSSVELTAIGEVEEDILP